jgi:Tfp pilus assembly protein PilE
MGNDGQRGRDMQKQRGISLMGLIITLGVLGFLAVMAAKLMPAYIDYFAVKKIFKSMEQAGDLTKPVREIRKSFDTRNTIEDVKSVKGDDLEVTKEGGETILTASWSVKVPLVANVSACLDFNVTTAK